MGEPDNSEALLTGAPTLALAIDDILSINVLEGQSGGLVTPTAKTIGRSRSYLRGPDAALSAVGGDIRALSFRDSGPDVPNLCDDARIATGRGTTECPVIHVAETAGGPVDRLPLPVILKAETDTNGMRDLTDDAIVVGNLGQRDRDGDRVGNALDADVDGDGRVATAHLSVLLSRLNSVVGSESVVDMDGDDRRSTNGVSVPLSLFNQTVGDGPFT